MPFYQVKDKYLFLHSKNYNKLNDIALKDKSDEWRFSSHIQGRKECIEAEKLRHKTINQLYKDSNYEEFYKEWIHFDLEEHQNILEDLPFLLYNYGYINRLFAYREIHDDVIQEFFPDLYYGKDCHYELALFSKSGIFKRKEKVFSTIIETKDIVCIRGELNDFSIGLKNKLIHFGRSITVVG